MYALEVNFQDGISKPEMILIKRPQAVVGGSDYAHVVIEDMKHLGFQLRLVRDLGRRFRCKVVDQLPDATVPHIDEGPFEGECSLDLGVVKFRVTALDLDLLLKGDEPPDRAGVRLLLRAGTVPVMPEFPAVVVRGATPMVVSFAIDQPILIGRSSECALRLDSSDVSGRHARVGFEAYGGQGDFWIEDLGSTNGTYVEGQQISGRVNVKPGVPIVIGREAVIFGVVSESQLVNAHSLPAVSLSKEVSQTKYPALVSMSEAARPARLVVSENASFSLGRDTKNDMWLGAPHISRRHLSLVPRGGHFAVSDHSKNGTAFEKGILKKGQILNIQDEPHVFDFGGGITVALCFNEAQERAYLDSQGSRYAFCSADEVRQKQALEASAIRSASPDKRRPNESSSRSFKSEAEQYNAGLVATFRSFGLPLKVMISLIVAMSFAILFVIGHLVWSIFF
jgi:pSer/pThr/pTyr-binding forkhead associated (FHA) protein